MKALAILHAYQVLKALPAEHARPDVVEELRAAFEEVKGYDIEEEIGCARCDIRDLSDCREIPEREIAGLEPGKVE